MSYSFNETCPRFFGGQLHLRLVKRVGGLKGRPIVALACGKVNLDPRDLARLAFGPCKSVRFLWDTHEADIQAAQQAAHGKTRIPGTHADPVGTGSPQSATEEGPQAACCPIALETRRALRSESLPRSWRLTRAADIAAVWRTGKRRRTPRLDLAWCSNRLGHPRLGLVVPRRGATAVQRNRLRRRLREIARRRLLPQLAPVDLVVRSRANAYQANFQELATDLEEWRRSLSPSLGSRDTSSSG